MTHIVASSDIAQVVEQLRNIRNLIKQMQKEEESLLGLLYGYMLENEELVTHDGEILLSWKYTSDIKSFDSKRFRFENEHLYEQYMITKPGNRRLLLK